MPVRRSFLAVMPSPAVEKPLTPDQITEAQYQTREREAAEPRESSTGDLLRTPNGFLNERSGCDTYLSMDFRRPLKCESPWGRQIG